MHTPAYWTGNTLHRNKHLFAHMHDLLVTSLDYTEEDITGMRLSSVNAEAKTCGAGKLAV